MTTKRGNTLYYGLCAIKPSGEQEPGLEARKKKNRYANTSDLHRSANRAELDMITRIVWANRGGTTEELDELREFVESSRSPVSKVGRHSTKTSRQSPAQNEGD